MSATAGALRLGLLGKLPAHGDFIRRGSLPAGFCAAWDAWLQDGFAAARAAIGEERWAAVWDAAPAWRFALPPGACGPDAAAGVMLPSRDAVGRRYPLTLAAVREEPFVAWPAAWFAALEGVARTAFVSGQDADAVAALLPGPDVPSAGMPATDAPAADPLAAFWASIAAENDLEHAAAGAETTEPAGVEGTSPPAPDAAMIEGDSASPGWWTAAAADGTPGLVWPLPALPAAEEFVLLLEAEA
ncbi:MAG: type VI secretion system-associated protein TagF [Acetobacteraceae bacterium]|nr:type VI secretion system-associated protein TagF [Acetobacteraceae bacterium]